MAARKLGGGRILGSGKSLAPPNTSSHARSSSLLSIGESVVSADSTVSTPLGTSPLKDSGNDLGSRVSLDSRNDGNAANTGSTKLVCPICNEEMMTLLQLNRHLDDDHRELPPVEQVEVKNWFEKQVVKAKKFQPLVVINQKLKGLDVFESNDSLAALPIQTTSSSIQRTQQAVEQVRQPDPDEVVTRTHWQRNGYNDVCTEPSCGKRLGPVNGNINCRKCGRLFCEDHTMYQMKLSRAAQHEPVRGLWCRCCETCYKSREGYNDHSSLIKNHTDAFVALRSQKVDKHHLEISRLEKRLSKLTQLLANPPEDVVASGGGLLSGSRNDPRKAIEQSIVTWEEDAKVAKCPFCQQEFGNWTFRRHHCRICGRVVCADSRTGCSSEIGLNVSRSMHVPFLVADYYNHTEAYIDTEIPPGNMNIDIRMCRDCRTTIFSRKDFEAELVHKPTVQKSYENLLQFERGIRPLLASFQKTLPMLQDPDQPPSHTQLAEAAKVRKRLIDSFGKYDMAAKRIRDLPTSNETEAKLQKAIYQQASNFLHLHMLPLKSLPKLLKHASPHGSGNPRPARNGGGGALAAIKYNDIDSASQMSSSSSVLAMEAEEKELRERLIVLEEQKFMVSEMIADANKRRKFDEVSSLSMNMEDLSKEIDQITMLPSYHEESLSSAIPAEEVTKVALRLRYLIEQCVPCELEVDLVTKAHSRIITHKVIQAAKEAGGTEYGACVVYALLVNKRWFVRQAMLEIWDAELHEVRATAAEVIAKQIIEGEEDMEYLMSEVMLKRYATINDGSQTAVANVIEKSVDLHALRVIGSSGYQKTVKYLWKGWLVQDDSDATTFVDYKQKANPNYWVHLNPDRMRAPIYQNATQVIISLVYLGLYTGAINTVNPTGDLDITEVLLYVFTLGFLCDEFSKFWKVGRFYLGFWNVFNLILYSLLTVSFVTRCIALTHPIENDHDGQRERFNELSYNFLAFSAPMFWGRLLLFMDTFRFFGAMLVVLKVMMKESLIFFALLIVVIIGFLQAFIGMDNVDNKSDATIFILQNMANAILGSPDFSGFDAFAPPFGIILYYIFTFTVMVILLNILIALYNSAYEDITGNALDEYMALFAQKTMQYVRAPDENVFIAPFNLIEIFGLILPLEWWVSKRTYMKLNDYVMAVIYAPLLIVAAFFEMRSARNVTSNRKRGEEDDDTIEEWEQLDSSELDLEGEGWTKSVESAKSNVDLDQATVEVRELREELGELKELMKSFLKEKQGQKAES
ncbi:hypothetical protein V502_01333 [Pseudogymnoascus sp. VKM F-4520 (FW-2644)]|nr:hypothetical protein V502_01333 [Pseudogymnoascus sp. VKM F-4520 (FW-2644)]